MDICMEIEQIILKGILNTKTEGQFARIVLGNKIPKNVWYNNTKI